MGTFWLEVVWCAHLALGHCNLCLLEICQIVVMDTFFKKDKVIWSKWFPKLDLLPEDSGPGQMDTRKFSVLRK